MAKLQVVLLGLAIVVLIAGALQFQEAVAAIRCLAPGFCDSVRRCKCTSAVCPTQAYCDNYNTAPACGPVIQCPVFPCVWCSDVGMYACQYCHE